VIAEQYGLDVAPARDAGAVWFVIDPAGRVRARGEGSPGEGGWKASAAAALGRTDVQTAGAH
jgi:hypothetical protein